MRYTTAKVCASAIQSARILQGKGDFMEYSAIVLAAGAGTRMRSKKPKVIHEILGVPLIQWVIRAAHEAGVARVVTVVGHGREQVEPLVANSEIVVQEHQCGTAHAVAACADMLSEASGSLIVLSGDCPLIKPETIAALVVERENTNAAAVVLTMMPDDPSGYGRVLRKDNGDLARIVEQKDATPQEAAVMECNSGIYCFDVQSLFQTLPHIDAANAQGEYYLTDAIAILSEQGKTVKALVAEDSAECLGVNSRAQLAAATKELQHRINARHLAAGVTMTDPSLVWIGPDVTIASDVELLPMTMLFGETAIGEDSIIGPNTRLTNTKVGRACVLDETISVGAVIEDEVSCGPRAYLRQEVHVCERAKVGTHVELKKVTIGRASKVPHLSYIGDASIGENVNVGAGAITCNYDGRHKFATTIEDGVFIGSDTMLIAPVEIGAGAVIGAGSIITKDVSADALALGRVHQTEIAGWAARRRELWKNDRVQ